jgi:hypothetical protein
MAALGQYHKSPDDLAFFYAYWAKAFPPSWHEPAALVRWLVWTHTGPLFAYPHGGDEWKWVPTAPVFGCFALGLVVRLRREPGVAALLSLPFALMLAAAALRRYPYGFSARITQILVPAIVLLATIGATWLVARIRPARRAQRAVPVVAGLLFCLGAGRLAHDLARPYRTPWDRTAREFARWFWHELSVDGELVCVRTDLGIPLRPGAWSYDGSDQYLCYQRIFSERHRQGKPPRWGAISATHPLRCVLVNRTPDEVPAFCVWMQRHRDKYTLHQLRAYPATHGSPVEPAVTYVVCEFLPSTPMASSVSAKPGAVRRR